MEEKIKCIQCGMDNKQSANFCFRCGEKLFETCDCWVKKKPYNCKHSHCLGYRLSLLEGETNNQIVFTSTKLADIGLKASKLAPPRERNMDKDL